MCVNWPMAVHMRAALITAVLFVVRIKCEQTPLCFSLVVSNSTPFDDVSQLISVIDQTLTLINNDSTILPGYHLQYGTALLHKCNSSHAQELFLTEKMEERSILAVMGCGCSSATEKVAELSQYFGIPMISYASTSSVLSSANVYQSVFRTVPSDEVLASALATLMNYYGWKKVIVLTQTTMQHQENLLYLKSALRNINVTAVFFDPRENLTSLIESESVYGVFEHVYILNMETSQTYFFLCEAYQSGHYYPNYLWITMNWLEREQWTTIPQEYVDTINCTAVEIQQVLNKSLLLLPLPRNQKSLARTATEISWVTKSFSPVTVEDYSKDAILALALSLNNTLCYIGEANNNSKNSSMCWNNTSLEEELKQVHFNGFSGPVLFMDGGNRPSNQVILQQYRSLNEELTLQTVATINETHYLYADSESNETVFPDGIPPDGTPLTVVISVEPVVIALTNLMLIAGLTFAIICLAFNIIYRNRRVVKLTSPSLSYVMILGLVGVFLATPSFPITDSTGLKFDCITKSFFLSTGYDIGFSVALVKLFRIWYIFNNPSPKKKALKDWHLLLGVAVIVGIDFFLTVPFQVVYALNVSIEYGFYDSSVNERGVEEIAVIPSCGDLLIFNIWSFCTTLFKFSLNVAGMVLVFLTRKVKVTILNEANYISAIIIANVIFIIIIVTLLVVVDVSEVFNFWRLVHGAILFMAASIFLGLTFVPKMIALYRDPEGKHIFESKDMELKQSQSGSQNFLRGDSTLNATVSRNV